MFNITIGLILLVVVVVVAWVIYRKSTDKVVIPSRGANKKPPRKLK